MIGKLFELGNLSGKRAIKEVVIKPTKDSLSILATSPDESVAVSVAVKCNPLGITEAIGITDITNIDKYLAILGLSPKVVIKENRLVLSSGRKRISSLLKSPEYVTSVLGTAKYNAIKDLVKDGVTVTIKDEDVKRIKDYMTTTGVDNFKLTLKGKEILVEVGNENTDIITNVIELEDGALDTPEVSVVLGQAFLDATAKLRLSFTVTMKKDCPVIVNSEAETYKYEALVALYG